MNLTGYATQTRNVLVACCLDEAAKLFRAVVKNGKVEVRSDLTVSGLLSVHKVTRNSMVCRLPCLRPFQASLRSASLAVMLRLMFLLQDPSPVEPTEACALPHDSKRKLVEGDSAVDSPAQPPATKRPTGLARSSSETIEDDKLSTDSVSVRTRTPETCTEASVPSADAKAEPPTAAPLPFGGAKFGTLSTFGSNGGFGSLGAFPPLGSAVSATASISVSSFAASVAWGKPSSAPEGAPAAFSFTSIPNFKAAASASTQFVPSASTQAARDAV